MEAVNNNEKVQDVVNIQEKRKSDRVGRLRNKKRKLLKKSERPGYGDDRFNETEYYFENGLRKVVPYYYTFTSYCKGRWINKKLIDVFATEFLAQPLKEFEQSIKSGTITVNGSKVGLDYVLRNNDLISNVVHRHEVPVVDQPIEIIHKSDDLVVINKPSSIPVHPCGRYRNNTTVFILGKENDLKDLRIAYRLDRLTSGLMIFSRTLEQDQKMKYEISNRLVQKQYLCRVEGIFPTETVCCKEPIEVLSHRIGICKVSPKGKECETNFERLSCNGKTSVVLCKPLTGRMHQIRVHLQYLGYPIVNDPLYNSHAFGPEKGKNGKIEKTEEELVRSLVQNNVELQWLFSESDAVSELSKYTEDNSITDTADSTKGATPVSSETMKNYDPNCGLCVGRVKFQDPKPSQLIMYLHCWKYSGTDWEFETEIPKWASADWSEEND